MNKWSCGSTTRLPKWLKMASHYLSAVVDAMCERARYLNPFPCWTFSKETYSVRVCFMHHFFLYHCLLCLLIFCIHRRADLRQAHTPTLLPDAALILQHSDLTSSF